MEIKNLIRPHLIGLKAYASARSEYSGDGILLDANENPLGSVAGGNYNRYTDPLQKELKAKIVHWLDAGLSVENIFCGNGSDEAIELLIKAFCNPGKDEIIICPPVFGMYEKSAQINYVGIRRVNLIEGFQLDIQTIKEQISEQTKIIFICSPNNPSGNLIHYEDIKIILNSFHGILVIDEAYIDFSNGKSGISDIAKYPNLVVLRTFSKAWGMAALRFGMAIGSPEVIAVLNTIKMPFNVNKNTIEQVSIALDNLDKLNQYINKINEEKIDLEKRISWLPNVKKVFPSDANYLLVKFQNPLKVCGFLKEKGIIVRDRSSQPLCEGCLRISVGNSEENNKLLEVLKEYTKSNNA